MTTLTDRYVWAVLRSIPEGQRPDLEPEIRALVADAVEAHGASGEPADAAERAALLELGDPDLLADRYVDRTRALIGPHVYPEWRRLLSLVLPIAVAIGTAVSAGAAVLAGKGVTDVFGSALSAAIMVAIQTVFWFTLVFAVIERTSGRELASARTWTLDRLPDVPDAHRLGIGDAVATVIANLFVAGGLLWVQLQPPIVLDGTAYPLFDPALWSFWLPWFLVVVAAEVVFTVALYLRGGWTWSFAAINAALGAAFAIPALWLLQSDLLLNPELVERIREAGGDWLRISVAIATVSLAAIAGWDAVDGFRKAWLNERRHPAGATSV
jgi:hypothetical protein